MTMSMGPFIASHRNPGAARRTCPFGQCSGLTRALPSAAMQITSAPDSTASMPSPILQCSIVVATKDRSALLQKLLRALERQTVPVASFEVLVVDDGSSDDTPDVLARAAEHGPL